MLRQEDYGAIDSAAKRVSQAYLVLFSHAVVLCCDLDGIVLHPFKHTVFCA